MNTVFLTGSSGGLGREIRAYYLDHGWQVAGFDVSDDGFTHENFQFFAFNSTDESSVTSSFDAAIKRFSAPRQLIATIGGLKPWKSVDNMSPEDFRFVVDLNLISTFLCCKVAASRMKANMKGSIVTIGAETALRPEPNRSAYVAAKAAVIAFTSTLALETKEYGVTANCLVPTIIDTKANESWGSPEEIPKWTKPKDIAALCFFLASDAGMAVNGSVLRVPNKM